MRVWVAPTACHPYPFVVAVRLVLTMVRAGLSSLITQSNSGLWLGREKRND